MAKSMSAIPDQKDSNILQLLTEPITINFPEK